MAMAMQKVHASPSPTPPPPPAKAGQNAEQAAVHVPIPDVGLDDPAVDYAGRAQWLRAAVLGANDGLVSVASLMVGVGAVNQSAKVMLVSGLAGLVAGACSMAIGEFVSVYAQYDIEVAQRERGRAAGVAAGTGTEGALPSPVKAAGASALAFAAGAVMPLLAGGFVRSWAVRVGVVCAVTTAALASFGAVGAVVGGVSPTRSSARVLLGGWAAMALSYAVLKLFSLAFATDVSAT